MAVARPRRCARARRRRRLVEKGYVRVNGVRVTAPAHAVKRGDVLTIALDARVRLLKIEGFVARRGDASLARDLYIELSK